MPRRGAQLRFSTYRIGGGAIGNVGRNTLTCSSPPSRTSPPCATATAPRAARTASRWSRPRCARPASCAPAPPAITSDDYEACALAASDEVARAQCLAADDPGGQPGAVTVLLIPRLPRQRHARGR